MQTQMTTPDLARDLARGYTLPADWYTDPAVLRLERDRIFARTWQYVGRTEQVREPGDFFAARAGHVPVAVVRGETGDLNGFVNVCRHRGHEVLTGDGNRRTLQCPYHAWTYGLDGCLRNAPRSDHEPGFPKDELSLLPVLVDTWGPFVFVNPDTSAGPLSETLGDLPEIVAESGLDLSSLAFHAHSEWTLNANWKVGLENYLECYHCAVAHPGFSAVIDVDEESYGISTSGWVASQRAPIRASALSGKRKKVAYKPVGEVTEAQYHLVWPNLTINIDPGRANLSLDAWLPDGPARTIGVSDQFFAPDVPADVRADMMAFAQQVGREDDALVESVQRGLNSGMVRQGRLLLGSEQLIHHFQRLVFQALAE